MDGQRFDDLTRSLAAVGSRRRLLSRLAAAPLAALATLLAAESGRAEHGCRHAGRACTRDGQCCSGDCLGNETCACTRASQCPPSTNPCKKAVCTAKGKCTFGNKADEVNCPDGTCCSGICSSQIGQECKSPTGCSGTKVCSEAGAIVCECSGPPILVGVEVPDSVVVGVPAQGTVKLDRPAQDDTTVQLSSSNAAIATVPSTVMVLDGQTSGTFTVTGVSQGEVTVTATLGTTDVTDNFQVMGPAG